MDRKEIVLGLRIHNDLRVDCTNCPVKELPNCFDWLIEETISLLEKEGEQKNEID